MKRKIAFGIIFGVLICAAIFIPSIVRNVKFNKAVTLIESGNYAKLKEGIEIFETIKEKNENRIEEYSSHYIDQLCEQNEYNSASEYVDLLKTNQILSESNVQKYSDKVVYGLATGVSWLCYYYAIQNGIVSVVVSIDKMSILVSVSFSYLAFHEKLSKKASVGLLLMVCGTLLMAIWG